MASAGNYGQGMVIGGMAQEDIGNFANAGLQARTARKAIDKAESQYEKYYNQALDYLQPYSQAGQQEFDKYRALLGAGAYSPKAMNYQAPEANYGSQPNAPEDKPFKFEAGPDYQYRVSEGMRGIEGSAAARGMQLSSATLKNLQKYGQAQASQEYSNQYNRYANERDYSQNKYLNQLTQYNNNRTNYNQDRLFGYNVATDQYNQEANRLANQQQAQAALAAMGPQYAGTLSDLALRAGDRYSDYQLMRGNAKMAGLQLAAEANAGMGQHFQQIGQQGNQSWGQNSTFGNMAKGGK